MAICPDCAREFYFEDEDNLVLGDVVTCEECGLALQVVAVHELELAPFLEADPIADADEVVFVDDFDENGYYGADDERSK